MNVKAKKHVNYQRMHGHVLYEGLVVVVVVVLFCFYIFLDSIFG